MNAADIEHRKPVWVALSQFYLDTELQECDFHLIASTIRRSPYTLQQAYTINKFEVFPALRPNLLSVAGEWAGVDEVWLIARITARLKNKNRVYKIVTAMRYQKFKWMLEAYWRRVEKAYHLLQQNGDPAHP